MTRSLWLLLISFTLGRSMAAGAGDHGFGPVKPVALPDIAATRHDGTRVRLQDVFRGRRTAVQFIFVDCQLACPVLGSLFRKVDRALNASNAQLVSITVNPERDSAARLATWREGFAASPRWLGLRVDPTELPGLLTAFGQKAGPPTGHTLQVFLVDGTARYVSRTTELPDASVIAEALQGSAVRDEAIVSGKRQESTAESLFSGNGATAAHIGSDRLDAPAARCSGCHGANGRGGGEGRTVAPDLRGGALTTLTSRRGGPPSVYSRESFCAGLRSGVDPAGVQYSSLMPRYAIDNRSCTMLWQFLTRGE